MPEEEQTKNGDYEFIEYHTFKAVDYDRTMAWKAGSGSIAVGIRVITPQRTDVDKEDVPLLRKQSAVVINTDFKLVRT